MPTRRQPGKGTSTGSSPAPKKAAAAESAQKAPKEKFGMYISPELLGRLRAAARHAMYSRPADGKNYPTMSDWLSAVLEDEVRSVEKQYNGGKQFKPAAPGTVVRPGPAPKR